MTTSPSPPKLCKTLLHNRADHTLTLTQHPAPPPTSTYHLVRVKAAALTNGELLWPEPNALAHPIPGFDVAGVIETSVPNSEFHLGDEVYGLTAFDRPGAAREVTEALPDELARKPRGAGWAEAATVPMSSLTAWQALFVHGGLGAPGGEKKGGEEGKRRGRGTERKRVLVTAASGGVGVWLIQLAKLAGAYVVGTCGPGNVDYVKDLGADEVLDYTKTGIPQWVGSDEDNKADLVVDCVGGKNLEDSWTAVKQGGKLISIVVPPDTKRPSQGVSEDVQSLFFIVEPDGRQLGLITELIEGGECNPVLDSSWRIEEWGMAWERVNGGHARGKVVLEL
jgi:NADPH:quinone reductase-like Zn-dependent oxidoreductase